MNATAAKFIGERYYEIIRGKKYMPPAPILDHDETVYSLRNLFNNIINNKSFKVFGENVDVVLDNDNTVQPDLKIISDFSKIANGKRIEGSPDFIVEVLSPSNSSHDLVDKKDLYEKHGVKEYWIVDIKNQNIYVYLLKDGIYGDPVIYHNYSQYEIENIENGYNDDLKEQIKIKEIAIKTFGEEIRVPIDKIFGGVN